MAISIATVWEVRATGASDNNGGGFVAGSGGTDRSQQNAAQVAVGGGVVTSSITTTVVTFTGSTYTVLAGDVGNIVQFISGTNVTAGFYQITSVSAGLNGTWTLDRTPLTSGTTTNAVANMGGALATMGKLAGAMVASNAAYCVGAFSSTATTTFAQTVASPTVAAPPTRLIGYGVTRGDGVMATLTLATNTGLTGIAFTGSGFLLDGFDVECASLGTSSGITVAASQNFLVVRNCKVANFTTVGVQMGSGSFFELDNCEITGGGAAATAGYNGGTGAVSLVRRCFIHDNACPGVILPAHSSAAHNLIVNNSGASSDGIRFVHGGVIQQNTVHNNGRHGLASTSANIQPYEIKNNVLTNNAGSGLTNTAATMPADPSYDGNAYFGNGSARTSVDVTTGIFAVAPYTNTLDITLTASPYIGPTTGTTANFGLNNAGGAGLALKGFGTPTSWPGNTGSAGFPDMGAVQSKPGGSPGLVVASV